MTTFDLHHGLHCCDRPFCDRDRSGNGLGWGTTFQDRPNLSLSQSAISIPRRPSAISPVSEVFPLFLALDADEEGIASLNFIFWAAIEAI